MITHATTSSAAFTTVLDSVVVNLSTRYEAARNLNELFSVVWKYPNMSSKDVRFAVKEFTERYNVDVTDDLVSELEHLKAIHAATLGDVALSPSDLLNSLHTLKLDVLFLISPLSCESFACCQLLWFKLQAERSFSTLARVKNVLRSTTCCQDQLNSLGIVAKEARLARTVNFYSIIELFASGKARKVSLVSSDNI